MAGALGYNLFRQITIKRKEIDTTEIINENTNGVVKSTRFRLRDGAAYNVLELIDGTEILYPQNEILFNRKIKKGDKVYVEYQKRITHGGTSLMGTYASKAS